MVMREFHLSLNHLLNLVEVDSHPTGPLLLHYHLLRAPAQLAVS